MFTAAEMGAESLWFPGKEVGAEVALHLNLAVAMLCKVGSDLKRSYFKIVLLVFKVSQILLVIIQTSSCFFKA